MQKFVKFCARSRYGGKKKTRSARRLTQSITQGQLREKGRIIAFPVILPPPLCILPLTGQPRPVSPAGVPFVSIYGQN